MIIRAHRFHGYNALRHVYGRGQTVRGQLLAIKFMSNPRRGSYRAAVVVSRKVHKSAVVRGRIRRRVYEIVRLQERNIAEPYDIIITVFSEQLATIRAAELQEVVVSLLRQAGIVTGNAATVTAAKAATKVTGHAIVDKKEPVA